MGVRGNQGVKVLPNNIYNSSLNTMKTSYWITNNATSNWAANGGDKKAAELTSYLQHANKPRGGGPHTQGVPGPGNNHSGVDLLVGSTNNQCKHHHHLHTSTLHGTHGSHGTHGIGGINGYVTGGPQQVPGGLSSTAGNHQHSNLLHKKTSRKKWKQLAKNAFTSGSKKNTSGSASSNAGSDQVTLPSSVDTLDCNCPYWLDGNGDTRDTHDLTLLQLLALNALELTAPASDVLLKNRSNNWVQLSGHEGSFALAGPGTIWKKRSSDCDAEVQAYQELMMDGEVCDLVPKFYRSVEYQTEHFIEMQDLLYNFKNPAIMDIKMGTRTFLEIEVQNMKARSDLYDKMVKVDPNAPTPQEREAKAITKLRYMQFRENLSSSSTLGFRIEGYKRENQTAANTEFKLVKTKEQVAKVIEAFLAGRADVCQQLVDKVRHLQKQFQQSKFFKKHEVIGSSLLLIYDSQKVGVWMIDFAKTVPLEDGTTIDHKSEWLFGNHEDGYLYGVEKLAQILECCSQRSKDS